MNKCFKWVLAALLAFSAGWAVAADIVLGAGDVLKVSVYGNPDLALETRVSETGNISFPLLGSVKVAGMAVSAAEKKLGTLLEDGGYLKKAQVNILVTVLQSQQISVLGQVNRPGRYPVEGKRTLIDVLALAGGANPDAADYVTLVRRNAGGKERELIDLTDMMRSGDMARNPELGAGDVVYVERAPKFYIYGEVQRPGSFRLERNMTVVQALSAGGGLNPRGTERGMQIKRRDSSGKIQVISAKHDDVIQPDDVIYIQERLF